MTVERDDPSRLARIQTLLPFAAALPLLLVYIFVLIERKYAVLLGKQTFLLAEPMSKLESAFYLAALPFQIAVFALTLTFLLLWILRRLGLRRRAPVLAAFGIALAYFSVTTLQFQALRYFKDTVELRVVKQLGGGDLKTALTYVKDELLGLLPLIVGALVVFAIGIWVLRKYGGALTKRLESSRLADRLVRTRSIIGLNVIALLIPLVACLGFPPLHRALSHSLAHEAYTLPWVYATDVDFDGYGLMSRPRDHAPFDSSRHPYAVEVPGNGIDENGVGGDLEVAAWDKAPQEWTAEFRKKNVVLIVLESARADLLEAEHQGQAVMPVLRDTPGRTLRVVSHVAFTSPSIVAVFNGTMSEEIEGISLIDRFSERGYRTGVFSGQHEGFGDKSRLSGMDRADRFRDSSTEDSDDRMYPSKTPASLKMPAKVMNARFFEWLDENEEKQSFFAYLNWQELHFPYSYEGIEKPLVTDLLPRGDISAERRDDLVATYHNAARIVDGAFQAILEGLSARGLRDDTVILILGDHGEELFDDGSLGHGTFLSHEQNETIAKIIGSEAAFPSGPIGMSEVATVLHNALCVREDDHQEFADSVLCYVGSAKTPSQLGIIDESGLRKYDFFRGQWSRQAKFGDPFEEMSPDWSIVNTWESFVLKRLE